MIIVLKNQTPREEIDTILSKINDIGLKPLCMPGIEKVVLGALGDERILASLRLESHPFVEKVVPILSPYKLASRELYPENTIIDFGNISIGAPNFSIIAGPCSVESKKQILDTASFIQSKGIIFLRGGLSNHDHHLIHFRV